MKLVLAEKPSVAQSIAKVLGANKHCDGYLEGNGYVVSWCVGHLVELFPPEGYDARYSSWCYEDLPILPKQWKYQVSSSTKKQFEILRKLMKRDDVECLVCATDAGREGELIFRLVYHQCGCKKPFERLWISSMEDSAIRDGFANLKSSIEYDALYEAALCRERADWMVGINATRLFSVLYSETLNVGRVMTPTLGMVVMREAAISAFKSEPFYTVQIIFPDFSAASERIKEKGEAEEILKKCKRNGKAVVTGVEQKNRWEKAPALYDLTSLQRDANRVLGYTAQQTLDYTQSLYEKKLVTYPRTDSRYLTSDMSEKISGLVSEVAKSLGSREEIVVNAAQVINNRKVSDHHAIIPTQSMTKADWKGLPLGERAVLKLIAVRLLAAVSKAHGYAETTMELDCAGVTFSAKGKAVREGGWKRVEALFCSESKSKEERNLPIVSKGDVLDMESTEIKEGKTTPPKHFTEDTLLQAMESAGSDEMPTEAERKGIGTPATRSGIIEKLVQKGFMERKGDNKVKHLIPTEKGIALIMVMPEQIQSASMTADWEEKLLRIERQDYEADAFLQEIEEMITLLVKNYKVVKGADVFMSKNAVVGKCPHCGSEVVERQKGWFCGNRECRFILWKDNGYFNQIGKKLTPHIVDELLRDGRTKLKDCKSKRTGKNYDATVLLFTEADGRAKFHMEFKNGGKE